MLENIAGPQVAGWAAVRRRSPRHFLTYCISNTCSLCSSLMRLGKIFGRHRHEEWMTRYSITARPDIPILKQAKAEYANLR